MTEPLATFFGDSSFPIEWDEGERDLFWVFDDLHCPNPLSPMFFDVGGWWLTCDHMFRRFGDAVRPPTGSRSRSTATCTRPPSRPIRPSAPRRPSTRPGTCRGCRGRRSTRAAPGAYLGWVLPHYAANFLDWWRDRLRPEIERNFAYLDERLGAEPDLALPRGAARGRARRPRPPLEDPLDAEFRAVLGDGRAERDDRRGQGRRRPEPRRPPARARPRSQLGLDRGALANEGDGEGRRGAAQCVHGRHGRRRAAGARGFRCWPRLRRRAARPVPAGVRRDKAIWSPRVRLPDLARAAGADRRGVSAATSRPTTTSPRRSRA